MHERQHLHERDAWLLQVGNLVHESVPVHRDEAANVVVGSGGPPLRPQDLQAALLGHADLVHRLGLADVDAGSAVAGRRAYFLMHEGVLLNQALIAYGMRFLGERGWAPVQTPFWLQGDLMARCAQLSQFQEELYRVVDGDADAHQPSSSPLQQHSHSTTPCALHGQNASSSPVASGSQGAHASQASTTSSGPQSQSSGRGSRPQPSANSSSSTEEAAGSSSRYLIATSEQALCAMHHGSWLEADDLPLQYAGFSTCFRREAGSHGKDTAGIFRVHQFDKVEQFAVTLPGPASWAMLDTMVRNAQDFYTSLGIPHRSVRIVSGALNAAAAAKVDVEAWFPASKTYRELVSASNCTDYQSRRLDIRLRSGGKDAGAPVGSAAPGSQFVHLLNCTLTATQRTLCCLLENHQTAEGVQVPAVLQPYLHGQDFIPFRRELHHTGRLLKSAMRHVK